MKSIKVFYDKLPIEARRIFRSLLPKSFLDWSAHKNTDFYLISYPKCGRTWLRLLIGRSISRHFGLPENEEVLFLQCGRTFPPPIPRITVVHDDFPMHKSPGELETSKLNYQHNRIIFLARDPRDVIVSLYFHKKSRNMTFFETPNESYKTTFEYRLSEFVNQEKGDIDTILKYFNIWAENRHIPKGFLLVRYEDMKANPKNELRRIFDFMGLEGVTEETIAEAVDFSSFENMRKMETEGRFRYLLQFRKDNEESYKTRKGKVGGFLDYLNEADIETLNQKIRNELSNFYGYLP